MVPTRTFHARIQVGNWILIFMLLIVSVYFIWIKIGLLIAVSLLLSLLVIERSIRTEYRLCHDSLVIHRGRLSKDIVIPMADIRSLTKTYHFKIGDRLFSSYVIVGCADKRNIVAFPDNIDGFIKQIQEIKAKRDGGF